MLRRVMAIWRFCDGVDTETLSEVMPPLTDVVERLCRIDTSYRNGSGLPIHLQAYCMRSEAKAALNRHDAPAVDADITEILGRSDAP